MLRIDPSSPIPLYAQIAGRIRLAVATGDVAPASRLPSVRQCASQLRVNPATVVRAYFELERDGVVETRGTAGVFAKALPQSRRDAERQAVARELVADVMQTAHALGITRDDLRGAFQAQVDSVAARQPARKTE